MTDLEQMLARDAEGPMRSSVLLIDDQPMVAEALRRVLESENDIGFHYCGSPLEAIAEAERIAPTLILLDLVMPEIDGGTLLRYLRANPQTLNIPVVMLSSKEDPLLKAEAFAEGANDYLIKWPDSVELLARIRYHSWSYIHMLERDEAFKALRESQKKLADTNRELRRLAATANSATKAKSAFLAAMSHDIRTPMTAILGTTELLGETRLSDEQSQYVNVIAQSGETLLALINDILDLSKIEAGQLELDQVPFDLRELATSTIEILRSQASKHGLKMTLRYAPELPARVVGDGQRLRQVLLNLLGNALKFTEEGEISLRVDRRNETLWQFCVRDTGIGVPADRHETIFKPFIQADRSTSRRFGGSGLGLAICRRLVDKMDGHIWVESEPDRGSEFQFTASLPLADQGAVLQPMARPQADGQQQPANSEADRPSLDILLVEDNRVNQMVVATILRKGGHRVTVAEHGQDGYEKFTTARFDLILMDMEMPVMDGYTATGTIRTWETETRRVPTPIIALTANAMREDTERALKAGCNQHLSKPVHRTQLLETVAAYGRR